MTRATDFLVLGAGVTGLSTAVRLREAGADVRVVAAMLPSDHPRAHAVGTWPPYPASLRAAAIWYPYHVTDPRVERWSVETLAELYRLADDPNSGVYPVTFTERFRGAAAEYAWSSALRRFGAVAAEHLPPGYAAGWEMEVPFIETPVYMRWLERRFLALGGEIERRFVDSMDEVATPGSVVVNCTGLGARRLLDDADVYPSRGQIVRVRAPGVRTWKVADDAGDGLTYVFARGDGVVLGGTAEDGAWDEVTSPEDIAAIRRRCASLVPATGAAEVLEVTCGLRPQWRGGLVRVEREDRADGVPVIHSYGHGGAGFTLSWGCADEVARMAIDAIGS
jgi:D-amino-acid oxidase